MKLWYKTSGCDISWFKTTIHKENAIAHAYISSPLKGNFLELCMEALPNGIASHICLQPFQRRLPRVMYGSPNQRHCLSYTSTALVKALFLKSYISGLLKGPFPKVIHQQPSQRRFSL